MNHRPTAKLAVAAVVLAAIGVPLPSFARGETFLSAPSNSSSGNGCGSPEATVLRWSPQDGPLAEFLADAYDHHQGNTLIGLGYDSGGFWSAEIENGWDACDDCSSLELVHTGPEGKRTAHLALQNNDEVPSPARHKRIKTAIFSIAKGPLAVDKLEQDYTMGTPAHDSAGVIQKFTGWFAEVHKNGTKAPPTLRFGLRTESEMCWCKDAWMGYALK